MNIFPIERTELTLIPDPVESARSQCNKHVVKMPLESAQMLCTAHRLLDGEIVKVENKRGKLVDYNYHREYDDILYRVAHKSHPCTLWTMETVANYMWHYKHFTALCDEYTYRYGKVHLSDTKLRQILKQPPKAIPQGDMTEFALAMSNNPECIIEGDAIQSYRNYYMSKQSKFDMVWSKRDVPVWFKLQETPF